MDPSGFGSVVQRLKIRTDVQSHGWFWSRLLKQGAEEYQRFFSHDGDLIAPLPSMDFGLSRARVAWYLISWACGLLPYSLMEVGIWVALCLLSWSPLLCGSCVWTWNSQWLDFGLRFTPSNWTRHPIELDRSLPAGPGLRQR